MSRQPIKAIEEIILNIVLEIKLKVEVKICGIKDEQSAIALGAEYVGFVFYKNSVRYVSEFNVKNLMSYLNKNQIKLWIIC